MGILVIWKAGGKVGSRQILRGHNQYQLLLLRSISLEHTFSPAFHINKIPIHPTLRVKTAGMSRGFGKGKGTVLLG